MQRRRERKKPEIAAPRDGHIETRDVIRGGWKLRQFSGRALDAMDEPFGRRDSITVVAHREDAGVEREALLDKYVERPERRAVIEKLGAR